MKQLITGLILLVASLQIYSATLIPADNKGLLYTGRIDFSNTNQPFLSWPGSSIKAEFTGQELVLILDDQEGLNYFNVILNGQDRFPYVLKLKQGIQKYDLSHMLAVTEHKSTT